jgi:signal transduction histidine kinase
VARHFLVLYLLILLTLAVVSWGQDKVLQLYGRSASVDDRTVAVALGALAQELRNKPQAEWSGAVADLARRTGADIELLELRNIAGQSTLRKLRRGDVAFMASSAGRSWALQQLSADYVLALESPEPGARRGVLEWTLTLVFYAAIALVLMIWIWPLTRDLRALEQAAGRFGNRNWQFEVRIKPHSQVYPLAQTFRKMAARIDELIASHKDLSNAVSHEIKTPLARMRFEIELAEQAGDPAEIKRSLDHLKADITAIDELIVATLDYAILDRAEVSLNLGVHDFGKLLPAIVDTLRRDAPSHLLLETTVTGESAQVVCDIHLIETVIRNLVQNAIRYARQRIHTTFRADATCNELIIDDDGPGIPEADRERVFESFVQLERSTGKARGFGLGLAIVRRTMEWHSGTVKISRSPLGGARVHATWPGSVSANASLPSRLKAST